MSMPCNIFLAMKYLSVLTNLLIFVCRLWKLKEIKKPGDFGSLFK